MLRGKSRRPRLVWIGTAVAVVALGIAAFLMLRSTGAVPTPVAFSEFLIDVEAGRVRAVTVAPDALLFERLDGTKFQTVAPQGYVASNPTFVTGITASGVRLDVNQPQPSHAGRYAAIVMGFLFLPWPVWS